MKKLDDDVKKSVMMYIEAENEFADRILDIKGDRILNDSVKEQIREAGKSLEYLTNSGLLNSITKMMSDNLISNEEAAYISGVFGEDELSEYTSKVLVAIDNMSERMDEAIPDENFSMNFYRDVLHEYQFKDQEAISYLMQMATFKKIFSGALEEVFAPEPRDEKPKFDSSC